MKKSIILSSIVFLFSLTVVFSSNSICGEFRAFGDQNYIRGTGIPVTEVDHFMIESLDIKYLLRVYNGGLVDSETAIVSSSVILINGTEVLGPDNFNQTINFLEVLLDGVLSLGENEISVELEGKPGGSLTVNITGVCIDEDNDGFDIEGGPCGPIDCNDNDPSINPGAPEICNGIDDDCNSEVDEIFDVGVSCSVGVGECLRESIKVCDSSGTSTVCDAVPGEPSPEVCDGLDNDCNGEIDNGVLNTFYEDLDQDTYGNPEVDIQACFAPTGYVEDNQDCDDTDPDKYPSNIEVCDGKDNDCDSEIDEGVKNTYYEDSDSDGYGNQGSSIQACTAPDGYVEDSTDCDDTRSDVNLGQSEVCDSVDNDCDGEIDEGVKNTYYEDADGDNFGNTDSIILACSAPTGYVEDNSDCEDSDASIYPGAIEECGDSIDQDCDGQDLVCPCTDSDNDNFFAEGGVCGPIDCNDNDPTINPGGKEICEDNIDQDCDGKDLPCILEDVDGDLWSVAQGDCDDTNSDIFPGATDFPGNGIDEDCDGQDAISPRLSDMDSDGYTAEDGDCHDQNPNTFPGATEIPCNGIDEDCDGTDFCNLTPTVEPESGYICGEVFDARTEVPLEGASIKMADAGQMQTDAQGKFSFPTPNEGVYLILIEKEGYTYAQRQIVVKTSHDFAVEPVYLVPIDPVTANITPENGGVLINSTNDVQLHFEPGAVTEAIEVSATRFYDSRELPGDLPSTSHFTTALELLPDGLTFDTPVRLLVENTYDIAPGTPVPAGYYRKDLGVWIPDGMGKITDDGQYMEYYITHFSPYDLNFGPRLPPNSKAPTKENTKDKSDNSNTPHPCGKAGKTGQSKVVYHDGELMEKYSLPIYQSLEKSNNLSLIYHSSSANPRSILSIEYNIDPIDMTLPEKVEFKVNIVGKSKGAIYNSTEGEINPKYLFNGINFRGEQLSTGSYPYIIQLTNWYPGLFLSSFYLQFLLF
ncbi:MAG: MopE-related protein [bacterium]